MLCRFLQGKTHFLKLKMLKIQIPKNEFVMVLKVTQQYNYRLSTEKKPLKNLVSKKKFKRLKIFILIKKCFSDAEKLF